MHMENETLKQNKLSAVDSERTVMDETGVVGSDRHLNRMSDGIEVLQRPDQKRCDDEDIEEEGREDNDGDIYDGIEDMEVDLVDTTEAVISEMEIIA